MMKNNRSNMRGYPQKRRSNSILQTILIILFIGVIVLLFFLICHNYLFIIKEIQTTGNERYNEAQIIKASGINIGGKLFAVDTEKAESKLLYELPYIRDVKIVLMPFNKISIEITEEKGVFSFSIGGDSYITSEDFRVLTRTDSKMAGDEHIINVKTERINRCFVGKTLVFSDDDIKDIIKELFDIINENDCFEDITQIDLRDKFKVSIQYTDRFEVVISGLSKLDMKFLFMRELIKEIPESERGFIYVISEDEALYRENG